MANNTDVIDLINENTVLRTHIKQRDARIAELERLAKGYAAFLDKHPGEFNDVLRERVIAILDRALLNTTS